MHDGAWDGGAPHGSGVFRSLSHAHATTQRSRAARPGWRPRVRNTARGHAPPAHRSGPSNRATEVAVTSTTRLRGGGGGISTRSHETATTHSATAQVARPPAQALAASRAGAAKEAVETKPCNARPRSALSPRLPSERHDTESPIAPGQERGPRHPQLNFGPLEAPPPDHFGAGMRTIGAQQGPPRLRWPYWQYQDGRPPGFALQPPNENTR